MHIYPGLGGQKKYGMLTRLSCVLPLKASAVMQFSVNNMSPTSLSIPNFSTPQRSFFTMQMCKISAPVDYLLHHIRKLVPLQNMSKPSPQFPKPHDRDPDLVNHVMNRQVF
jgi:hypothetical protein